MPENTFKIKRVKIGQQIPFDPKLSYIGYFLLQICPAAYITDSYIK